MGGISSSFAFDYDINTDLQGNVCVTGNTDSVDFPTTPNVFLSAFSGERDAFVSILATDFTHLLVSYYLGGSASDFGYAIAIGPEGAVYTAGGTSSTDFPVTPGSFQTTLNGTNNAFVTKTAFTFYRQASVDITGMF